MQTLRREIKQILLAHFPRARREDVEKAVDAILRLRAFQQQSQAAQQPNIDWLIAAGVSAEKMAEVLERERKREEIARTYEEAMGYNPLRWETNPRLRKLLDFLMTKNPEEIRKFALWANRPFSSFDPADALQNPDLVEALWPQAMRWNGPESYRLQHAMEQLNEWARNG
jgi:hypothetical protein